MRKVVALLTIFASLLYAVSSDAAFKTGPRRLLQKGKVVASALLPGAVGQVNMISVAPQNYENSTYWTYQNVQDTSFATKTIAPDGTNTGEKFIASVTNSNHTVLSPESGSFEIRKVGLALNYKLTCFAKSAGYTRLDVSALNLAGSSGAYATYDLTAGKVLAGGTGGANVFGSGFAAIGTEVVNAGNGWWRLGLTFTSDTATSISVHFNLDNGSGQAARSVSFAGDTTSGVYLWTCNLLPAAAWNHITKVFEDNFTTLSTIDTTNSKAPGFKWYLGGPWPNSTNYTNVSQVWRTATQQTSGNFAIGADGLAITGGAVSANSFGLDLMSTAYTSGSSYVGTARSAGGLQCASVKFDPSLMLATQTAWPAIWNVPQEFLTGSTSHFFENDIFEALPTGTGTYNSDFSANDWTIVSLSISANEYGPATTYANNDNVAHKYCDLWITAAENGGVGYHQHFIDSTYFGLRDLTYSSGAGANPAATPSNPSGIYFEGDSQTYSIILTSWPTLTTYYQYMRVWQ